MENAIVQLNKYPKDKYNVLSPSPPCGSEQPPADHRPPRSSSTSGRTAPTGAEQGHLLREVQQRLCHHQGRRHEAGAAANISIVDTATERTEGCQRCIEMARATGKPRVCGTCEHVHDVAVTVTIRVPEPSGGFRLMKATKEIDCTLEAAGMKDGANGQQFRRFLPHRTAMAESKAFMRLSGRLGLAGTYAYEELKKPFIVARVVPNLDARKSSRPWRATTSSRWVCSLRCPPRRPGRASRRRRPPRPSPLRG